MKLLIISLVFCITLVGQVTPAKNVQVGPLSCAGRVFKDTQVFQGWCYKGGTLVVNSLMSMGEFPALFIYYDEGVSLTGSGIMWQVSKDLTWKIQIVNNSKITNLVGTF
jgi:hypothetical protein